MRRCFLVPCDGEDNSVSLGGHNVRPDLIEIEHDAGDVGGSAVLGGADLTHSVDANGDILRAIETDGAGKIQQDAVRVHRSLDGWLDRSANCNLDF